MLGNGLDLKLKQEGDFFIGRTEFDSPDVDNEIHIDARLYYVKIGDFIDVKITNAGDFDLEAVPLSVS